MNILEPNSFLKGVFSLCFIVFLYQIIKKNFFDHDRSRRVYDFNLVVSLIM